MPASKQTLVRDDADGFRILRSDRGRRIFTIRAFCGTLVAGRSVVFLVSAVCTGTHTFPKNVVMSSVGIAR